MATKLTPDLLDDTLRSLPGWQGGTDQIWREIRLDEGTVRELRQEIEVAATTMAHPVQVEPAPDGCRVVLTTPEDGGVTELDIVLAARISDVAHRLHQGEPGITAVRQDDVELVVGEADPDLAGTSGSTDNVPVRF